MNIFELAIVTIFAFKDKGNGRSIKEGDLYNRALAIVGDSLKSWEADVGEPENLEKEFSR